MEEIKSRGSGRIFDNSLLEALTKSSPILSFSIYSLVILGLLYRSYLLDIPGSFWSGAVIFLAALFGWTLFEYIFHRYINHLDHYFPNSPTIEKIDYIIHGIHHEYPRDTERLIMPPVPGLLIISILFGTFYLLLGSYVYIFLPGFMTGYLIYTQIHVATHRYKPIKPLKHLWRHHALHHYQYPDRAFGVSTTLWDRIFGTMPPSKEERRREASRET